MVMAVGTTPMIGSDVILYAQWQENDKPIPPTPRPKPGDNTKGQIINGGIT